MKIMTKTLSCLLLWAAIAVLGLQTRDAAAQDEAAKLTRGAAGMAFGILELPGCIKDVSIRQGPTKGWTWGFAKGIGMIPVRTVVGVFEFLTFMIPTPAHYAPILQPETPFHYFYEDWEPKYVMQPER